MNQPRKRDLLLTLKYSTIEASFSVPMLTLTMSNLAFAIGFAVKILGWGPAAIGFMAAAPHICNFLQPPIMNWLQRRLSLYDIMIVTFALTALPWAFISVFPWLHEGRHAAFALIISIASLANAVCGVAWSAAISEVVPLSIRGKYFGKRNLIYGTWTLIVVLVAGRIVDFSHDSIFVFGAIFAAAALMRMIALLFLTRMRFPAAVVRRVERSSNWRGYAAVFQDKNYLPLLLFVGLWGLLLNLGAPFYNLYVLHELPLSFGDLAVLTMLASFGGLVSLTTWGALSDRFGNKPVLFASAIIWAGTAMLSWLFAGREHYWHLYLTYFIVGFMTAGFQLTQFNLMIKLVPAEAKSHYISVFFSFTSLLTAIGPMLGGRILDWLPRRMGDFLGQPLLSYHVLFVGSLCLCFLAVYVLLLLHEPAERPLTELVRVMSHMREFNPILGLASLAQFMFTPQEITRFARRSMRSLRKQTGTVTEIGEELVEESWRVLKEKFERNPSKPEPGQSNL